MAYCYRGSVICHLCVVCLSCLLVTMNPCPAKTDEPNQVPFGGMNLGGPNERVPDSSQVIGQFWRDIYPINLSIGNIPLLTTTTMTV